jgi:hypothetical protein
MTSLPTRIAALREAEKNRTPGEWENRIVFSLGSISQDDAVYEAVGPGHTIQSEAQADANYIAATTQHLAPLLEAVEGLLMGIEDARTSWCGCSFSAERCAAHGILDMLREKWGVR